MTGKRFSSLYEGTTIDRSTEGRSKMEGKRDLARDTGARAGWEPQGRLRPPRLGHARSVSVRESPLTLKVRRSAREARRVPGDGHPERHHQQQQLRGRPLSAGRTTARPSTHCSASRGQDGDRAVKHEARGRSPNQILI